MDINIRYLFIICCSFFFMASSCSREVKKEHYDNGKLKVVAHYKNGQLDGLKKKFDKNGNLVYQKTYENGKKEGLHKYYYKNKKIRKEVEFDKGVLNGKYTTYYKNGNIKSKGTFRNGEQHCLCKWFYNNAENTLKKAIRFKKGKRKGKARFFFKNGQLKLYSIKKNDSTIVYNEKYDSTGKFLNEYREIQVQLKKDTVKNGHKLTFQVKPYGPTYHHYDSFFVKLLAKNAYGFKDSFDTQGVPEIRLKKRDLKIYGDTAPAFRTKYHIEAYEQKVKLENSLGLLPIKAEWAQKKKQFKDSVFHLTYSPNDTGDYILLGSYGLIPTDTAPVKSIQEYPFSVRFYVKP